MEIYLTREKEIDPKRAAMLGDDVMQRLVLGRRPDLDATFEEPFGPFLGPKSLRNEQK